MEKIGLPPKPSLRGNSWVIDASNCQGCSSQFSFINRKHHCRRCGGLFCNSCTQQRMVLRGQGDSPVRICEPCKKLEEASRFELRHGHRPRAGKGASKSTSTHEDDILNEVLGTDKKGSFSSGRESNMDLNSALHRATSSASCSDLADGVTINSEGDLLRSLSVDEPNLMPSEVDHSTPEELRQQALEEKKKYKILKGEGKSDEALRAFKRGKELERQADALETKLRKTRKKASSLSYTAEAQTVEQDSKEFQMRNRLSSQKGKEEKDHLVSELRELGWSDLDLHDADKKPVNMTLEGEFSTLIGEISQNSNSHKRSSAIDKSQVIAHKKKALVLKREGKLAEAKEELKKAKLLEKEIEEQEFLAEAEDSDDELSSLMRNLDNDKQDDSSAGYSYSLDFNIDRLMGIPDDIGTDHNFEVTEDDLDDPEMASALKSLGWTEDDPKQLDESGTHSIPVDRERLLSEVRFLKREAVKKKQEGNAAEAMSLLKKAKLLENNLEGNNDINTEGSGIIQKNSSSKKSKLMIQKELLAVKKKALSLRREGKFDEAEEELKKGQVLEKQLEEYDKVPEMNTNTSKDLELQSEATDLVGEEDVTDQDLNDPTYLSFLKNLGWQNEENENPITSSSNFSKENEKIPVQITDSTVGKIPSGSQIREPKKRKSKVEIQREILGLKRKALALRRKGDAEEAEEVLSKAKELEAQLADPEGPRKEDEIILAPPDQILGNDGDVKGKDTREYLDLKTNSHMKQSQAQLGLRPQLVENNNTSIANWSSPAEKQMADMTMDLLTGDEWKSSETSAKRLDNEGNTGKAFPSLANPSIQLEYSEGQNLDLGRKDDIVTGKRPETVSLQQQILALKRKAVSLKREGKMAEAREQLRQAKLLEKNLEAENPEMNIIHNNVPSSLEQKEDGPPSLGPKKEIGPPSLDPKKETGPPSLGPEKETTLPSLGPKLISGRERFKLQQESLAHKRQALKLRREGRTEEAEIEFERAKALEAQLEEVGGHDSNINKSINEAEQVGDLGVEDLLDPQLLSALKAIGLQDNNDASTVNTEKPNVRAGKNEISSKERTELEEKIKAEKVKAVNLKRSGKQTEALDALRRAKMHEKKLHSSAS